jgi:opacity protein-like surface antigen
LVASLSARLFVAGRAGSIAHAQASTRNALLGAGLAVALPFRERRFELGLRGDLFVSYFDATHLSEDDVTPDRRSRWLPGGDLVAEGGFRFDENAGVFLGAGIEAMLGKTDLYTHGQRVAVVPVLRAVGEMGFRIGF